MHPRAGQSTLDRVIRTGREPYGSVPPSPPAPEFPNRCRWDSSMKFPELIYLKGRTALIGQPHRSRAREPGIQMPRRTLGIAASLFNTTPFQLT